MKRFLGGGVIICSVLVLAGAGPAQNIKVGGFLPMTGAVAAYGQDAKVGIEVAMGMKPTVLGKKVEFVIADTKSDKIEAANAMSRLTERDKVAAVLGGMIRGNTM